MSHSLWAANRRILVIDDNPAIHADFRKILGVRSGGENDELTQATADLFGSDSDSTNGERPEFEWANLNHAKTIPPQLLTPCS
jgi:hypothetical protein